MQNKKHIYFLISSACLQDISKQIPALEMHMCAYFWFMTTVKEEEEEEEKEEEDEEDEEDKSLKLILEEQMDSQCTVPRTDTWSEPVPCSRALN